MPVGNQEHRRVPVTVSVAFRCLNELLNLGLGQVTTAPGRDEIIPSKASMASIATMVTD
jgi:hypothetical protein